MTLIIKNIARVSTATGEVKVVETAPGANLPVEGVVGDEEIIWIPSEGWEGIEDLQIIEQYYRKDGAWVKRGSRPTPEHSWNTETEAWELDTTVLWMKVRQDRDQRLFVCDWTQMPDCALSASQKDAWAIYRQALRDVPAANSSVTSLNDITWPTPPS